jgi:hypothetical protein
MHVRQMGILQNIFALPITLSPVPPFTCRVIVRPLHLHENRYRALTWQKPA